MLFWTLVSCALAAPMTRSLYTPAPTDICTVAHIIREGESCSSFETSHQLSFAALSWLNPDKNCQALPVGAELCLEWQDEAAVEAEAMRIHLMGIEKSKIQMASGSSCANVHIGTEEDTCFDLMRVHGMTVSAFHAQNPHMNCHSIVGEPICIQSEGIASLSAIRQLVEAEIMV